MWRYALILLFVALPALSQTQGSPETVLSGIDIHHTLVADVTKMYGEPEGVFAVPAPYPEGTKQYKWGRLTVTLLVLTRTLASGDRISAIQIQGEGDGKPISRTGRGLKLSDKSEIIKKLYGVEAKFPETTLEWPSGETLVVHLNDKSRVDRLELSLKDSPK
jgi:hypothetical protein